MKKIGTKQLVPILTAIMGVVFAVLGFTQLGFWDKTDGPMPGFFPSIMAIVMVLSSILALIQSFKEDEKAVFGVGVCSCMCGPGRVCVQFSGG